MGGALPSGPFVRPCGHCWPISAATRTASRSPTAGSVALVDGRASFRWRDYQHQDKNKVMTLAADEFIRRFLLHALPDRFHGIRHYGFLANRRRVEKLALCRTLLAVADAPIGDTPRATCRSAG